jgi:glycosyltransferase involved in cell wall biosynthesis
MNEASVIETHVDEAVLRTPLRVAAFTGGREVASARFRLRQFITPLRAEGIEIYEHYPAATSYPPLVLGPATPFARALWGMRSLSSRIPAIIRSHHYDLTFLQREMISKHITLEWATRGPRIFDVDDAIWLDNGSAADRIARICDLVICGNQFLAEHFSRYSSHIEILPTAVDSDRFIPEENLPVPRREIVIGWSGAAGGLYQLETIASALGAVLRANPHTKLMVLCQKPASLRDLPAAQVEFRQWNEATEVRDLQAMDIGIMPLPDDERSRGKCSYKMLLYMACGLPVVVSPVGMNLEVLALGEIGYSAHSMQAWTDALTALVRDRELAARMGRNARAVILGHFDRASIAHRLAKLLRRVFEGRRE